MPDVLEYKCPSCGAPLVFDSDSQYMRCGHCDSRFETAALQEYEQARFGDADCEWESYGRDSGGDWQAGERENLRLAVCPSCGGELIGDAVTIAAECPYCDNVMILRESVEGRLRPDLVVPFQLDKETAMAALKKFYQRKPLLPRSFKEQNHIERVRGVYVPFWLFDCDTDARISYKATRVSSRSDSRYNYTTTRHYHVLRAGDVGFARVPVDGSAKMDDALMEALEPYDYRQSQPFSTTYLSGFLADRYDVDAAAGKKRANERIRASVRSLFDDTVRSRGYSSYHVESVNIRLKKGAIRYALLPVWLLNTKYRGNDYLFAMNGQTGKFVGRLPVAWGKFWGWFFGIFLGLSGVGAAVAWLAAGGV
ncbi:MAG: hypothetical protein LBK56_02940 [Gracilibacteraceae bacterium]|jgi:DNA-directed RNA polymerase subunit RPC12/RpoP|nr:hypothetical protein [Gracilibacteraceae bacterium]